MHLKKVEVQELDKVTEIMIETAEWLQQIGSKQWSAILDGEDQHDLSKAVPRGDVYFFYDNDTLVGMAAAWSEPTEWDKLLWEEKAKDPQVYYLHRIIIRPKYHGKQFGKQLLETLTEYFTNDAQEVRLDCIATNTKLLEFYQKNGFINVGKNIDTQGTEFALFSLKLN